MDIRITELLPESTYQDWVKFASAGLFFIKHARKATPETATDVLMALMFEVEPDPDVFNHLLEHEILKIALEPVNPRVLMLATMYHVIDVLKNPDKSPETLTRAVVKTLSTMAEMLAACYDKAVYQTVIDIITQSDADELHFEHWRASQHIPTSKELH